MAKASKKEARTSGSNGKPALAKRYGSVAEIKRDLFPNAAAEEAEAESSRGNRGYETLMAEFFGPGAAPPAGT